MVFSGNENSDCTIRGGGGVAVFSGCFSIVFGINEPTVSRRAVQNGSTDSKILACQLHAGRRGDRTRVAKVTAKVGPAKPPSAK